MGGAFSTNHWKQYAVLPIVDNGSIASPSNEPSFLRRLPKRYSRLVVATLVALGIFWFLESRRHSESRNPGAYPEVQLTAQNLPPLYSGYREYEDHVSEENLQNLTTQKFLFFANHAAGCGWGNVLQEMVFSTLVASASHRSFVWVDYTWERETEYSHYNGKKIPSKIPLSTMLSGYLLGQNNENSTSTDNVPPSISWRVYNRICPQSERVIIDRDMVKEYAVKAGFINNPEELGELSGRKTLDVWLSALETTEYKDAKCVDVRFLTLPPFDIWFFGSAMRMLDLWDTLSHAPILTNWGWSKLIHQAFERNIRFFVSAKDVPPESKQSLISRLWPGKSTSSPSMNSSSLETILTSDTSPLPILALHIRRGDFKDHCMNLAEWSASYNALSAFPEFASRDDFVPPKVVEHNNNSSSTGVEMRSMNPAQVSTQDEKRAIYAKHCFPDIPQVVKRVREVVTDYNQFVEGSIPSTMEDGPEPDAQLPLGNDRLHKVYIMTNGDRAWLVDLKKALAEDARSGEHWEFEWAWEDVTTSRDLDLGWEEKPVGQVLDMFVAQRAEMFVGNGFSSLTSNIVMLRKKNGFDPVQTRFW